MAEASAQSIQPVNATSTNTVPNPSVENAKPAEAKKASPAKQKFESQIEETLWRVNEPTSDETEDIAKGEDIIDKATKAAGKSSKEANADLTPPPPKVEEPKVAEKKKYTVTGPDGQKKVYELDDSQAQRFAQLGILSQLKSRDQAKAQEALEQEKLQAQEERFKANQLIEGVKKGSFEVLEQLHGKEGARRLAEQYLLPIVQREMMPAEQRLQIEKQEAEAQKDQEIAQLKQQLQERDIAEKSKGLEDHYQKVIINALEAGGIPKTEFAAKEMAEWMSRGLDKGIEYSPEQLAKLVRQDNMKRVGAMTHTFTQQIEAATKSGNAAAILQAGKWLVEMLGEPIMMAIGKYHLAKMKSGKPAQNAPQQVLSTSRVAADEGAQRKKPYLTMDEQQAERKRRVALMEQGIDPGEWK